MEPIPPSGPQVPQPAASPATQAGMATSANPVPYSPILPQVPRDMVTTTIFISNLHCPSCVSSISESLSALEPTPELVSHSIVSHSVVIRHPPSLAVKDIIESLDVAGFEVHSMFQNEEPVEIENHKSSDPDWEKSLERAVSRWRASHSNTTQVPEMDKRQKHVDQCEECKAEAGGVRLDSGAWEKKPIPYVETKDSVEIIPSSARATAPDSFVVVESTPSRYKAVLEISGMTCASCVSSITNAVQGLPWVQSVNVNLLTNSGVFVFDGKGREKDIVSAIEDTGFDATVDSIEELKASSKQPDLWRATYAIGGMTCSSCVGNVTNALKPQPWIQKVDVNLVSNSATVIFSGHEHLAEVQQTIEDAGYDATLDSVSPDQPLQNETDRSVMIRIDGMYCHHCPGRITKALQDKFSTFKMDFEEPLLSQRNAILRLKYRPDPPDFTVRHIFDAIASVDPGFKPSVYHPPTIEERAQEMHMRERRRIWFRLILAVAIAIPTFVLGIVFMSLVESSNPSREWVMKPMWVGNVTRVEWALFILSTPVYFLAADQFHRRAFKEVKALWRPGSRTPILQRFTRFGSMNMLMSLGTSIAYFASIAELALAATRKSKGSMSDSYFDSVVFLTMFILIGRFLEAYSKARTGDAVTSLGKLRPQEAILWSPNATKEIPTDLLEIGDVVLVPHGASPPFDGDIVEGAADFDESSLTGESRPVKKNAGDTVYSGTINNGQPTKVKITTVAGTSMLDQIINVVREGQTHRAPVERVADKITSHFVPFVVAAAIVTWLVWLLLGSGGAIPKDWREDGAGGWALWSLRFAIAVFVVACPCGIGLAAPTALFVGGGLAAKHGILVKGGGEAFQEASSLDCIVFDKTGTLTEGGDPKVTDHEIVTEQEKETILGIVKALEENSNHPIARALVSFCAAEAHQAPSAISIEEVPGKGLRGTFKVEETTISAIIGNEAFMSDHNILIPQSTASHLETWKSQGKSIALAATQSKGTSSPWALTATFSISDPIRPSAQTTISTLQQRNISVWLLSGDNPTTATAIGTQLGIPASNIIAGVLPEQKAEKIKYLQRTLPYSRKKKPHATVAMVGDGINDAPALSTADLSIAIGSGSDIAVSSSSFILINSNLGTLITLLDLSRTVFRRVYFNFGWALIYNLIAMPIAAGVLFPITTGGGGGVSGAVAGGGMDMAGQNNGTEGMSTSLAVSSGRHVRLDPVWASLAMALSSVSVVCSSLLLRSGWWFVGFRVEGRRGKERKEEERERV